MTNLIEFGLRNILLWAGAGAVAVPILCHLLGTATRDTGSDKKAGSNSIVPDQLQAIEGVGPQIASVLYSAGLSSFREISNAKPQEIQSALDRAGPKYKLANPATWPEQARLLADGNIEGFLKLAVSLTAGVTVLENIDGIGEAIGERLRLADINTVAKLGNASEDEIQTALVGSAKSYSIRTITAWKAQAEKFAGGDIA